MTINYEPSKSIYFSVDRNKFRQAIRDKIKKYEDDEKSSLKFWKEYNLQEIDRHKKEYMIHVQNWNKSFLGRFFPIKKETQENKIYEIEQNWSPYNYSNYSSEIRYLKKLDSDLSAIIEDPNSSEQISIPLDLYLMYMSLKQGSTT